MKIEWVRYSILYDGNRVGAIEGVPGQLDYVTVERHWGDKGVAHAAVQAFVDVSRDHGCASVVTNNTVHPVMARTPTPRVSRKMRMGASGVKPIE